MLAYTIVLAHSIVPHHHHHQLSTEKTHHDDDTKEHDDDTDEHDDIDDSFLGQPFSFFQHDTGNSIVYFTSFASLNDSNKPGLFKEFLPIVDFLSIKIELQFLKRVFPPEKVYVRLLLRHSSALFRGPPFLLV